ncbi:beta strand repeat-containing protein [Prochlorococcus sp. MIT 1201]|uniref:beta strand repeat-containing protein n=1 Tax=Prochlorococcus sp. MIT 1201 TaxID=3082535 RepID=UPI0039A54441
MAFTTLPGTSGAATTLVGTSGIDSVSIGADLTANVFVGAQQAADVVNLTGAATRSQFSIKGGQGADTFSFAGSTLDKSFINGNANVDTFGSDTDRAQLTTSTIRGGQGIDSIFVSNASGSFVNGNKQADTINLSGVAAASEIHGGADNDNLTIGNLAQLTDTLVHGDKGNDTITVTLQAGQEGISNNSTVQGGEGNDTLNGSTATASLLMAGGTSSDSLDGGSNTDTINGGDGADSIDGNAGADQLSGGDGNDEFIYQNATDLFSGAGPVQTVDLIDGQGGIDEIVINNEGRAFTITAANTWDPSSRGLERITAFGGATGNVSVTIDDDAAGIGITRIDLSADTTAAGNDTISGATVTNAFNLTLIGSAGSNNAIGGAGTDTIDGGLGVDNLSGGLGTDSISGGVGTDTIDSGQQADTITGGDGADDFVMESTGAAFVGANADTILNFVQGAAGDALRCTAANFAGLTAGQATNFLAAAGGSANAAATIMVGTTAQLGAITGGAAKGNTRMAYNVTTGQWLYDANGDWAAGSIVIANCAGLTLAGLNTANLVFA